MDIGLWPDASERWLTSGVAMGRGKKPMPFGKLCARNCHPARSARWGHNLRFPPMTALVKKRTKVRPCY